MIQKIIMKHLNLLPIPHVCTRTIGIAHPPRSCPKKQKKIYRMLAAATNEQNLSTSLARGFKGCTHTGGGIENKTSKRVVCNGSRRLRVKDQ